MCILASRHFVCYSETSKRTDESAVQFPLRSASSSILQSSVIDPGIKFDELHQWTDSITVLYWAYFCVCGKQSSGAEDLEIAIIDKWNHVPNAEGRHWNQRNDYFGIEAIG